MAAITIPAEQITWVAALVVAWGLIDCFFGYRLFRVLVGLAGALAGAWLGAIAAQRLGFSELPAWLTVGFGAVLGAWLAFGVFLAGVFLAGFGAGASIALGLIPAWPDGASWILALAAGVATGLLALALQRILISAGTAWSGALRAGVGGFVLYEGRDPAQLLSAPEQIGSLLRENGWLGPACLGLGLIGFIVQMRRGRPTPPAAKDAPH